MSPNPQFPADFVRFTEEIPNGKLHFLCNEMSFRRREHSTGLLHKINLLSAGA